MPIIKRYSNRKLYDSLSRRYVTLEEIGWMVQNGEDVTVIDHDSGMDITAVTLTQVIFDQEKRLGGLFPQAIFSRLIKARDVGLAAARHGVETLLNPSGLFDQELTRRLDILLQEGKISEDEFNHLSGWLLDERFHPIGDDLDENISEDQLDLLREQLTYLEDELEKIKQNQANKDF